MALSSFARILLKTLGVLAFCVVSAFALFLAYGYNYDLSHRDIEKTSIIDITSVYQDVQVMLDGQVVAHNLPYLIKDVIPALYRLSVVKDGFLPWSRDLVVINDFVTKVPDILLFPSDLKPFIRQLLHFPDSSRFFSGKGVLAFLSSKQPYLTVVNFLPQGTMNEDEVDIPRQDIKDIALFGTDKFLITFNDDTYEWVSFRQQQFVSFNLPAGNGDVQQIIPADDGVYFWQSKSLYRIPFDAFGSKNFPANLPSFLLRSGIERFALARDGIYYLSNGMVYYCDKDGKHLRIIDLSLTHWKDIRSLGDSGNGYLVLTDTKGTQSLFSIQDDHRLLMLNDSLSGDVFVDDEGKALYSDNGGRIFSYEPSERKEHFITTLKPASSLIGWFGNDGHFLYLYSGVPYLADLSYSNIYAFKIDSLQSQKEASITDYFIKNQAVYYITDNRLWSVYWLKQV